MPLDLAPVQDPTLQSNLDEIAQGIYLPVPQARVFNNANINITTSGTRQALTFNSERYDVGDLHSTSVNTSRLTASLSGLYVIGADVEFASNATGKRQIEIRVDGTTLIAVDTRAAVNGDTTICHIATEYRLNAGQYVEVTVVQTSGGALFALASSNYSPEFWMHRRSGFTHDTVY